MHAGAGGVGLLLTQVVKLRGGRVIATTSSDEKAELACHAGADEVIGYDEVADHANEFAVVYDGVGQATFDGSLAALRPRGTLVLYGAASGPAPRSTRCGSRKRARSSSLARRSGTAPPLSEPRRSSA